MSITIEQIPETIRRSVESDQPILLSGPPGATKTAQAEQWAKDNGWGYYNFTVPERNQPELVGFPVPMKKEVRIPEELQVEGGPETHHIHVTVHTQPGVFTDIYRVLEDYDRCLINLDEIMSGDTLMKKALSSFVQDRAIGGFKLPDNCRIIATGNRQHDRAGVTGTPMQLLNRFSVIDVIPTFEGWRPWAFKQGIHPLYISAVEQHESVFISKEVPADNKPFSTLRSLTKAHAYHMAGLTPEQIENSLELPTDDITQEAIAGFIGEPAAVQLMGHLENWKFLPTRAELLANPSTCKCPDSTNLGAVLTASELAISMIDVKNADTVWTYVERMPVEIQTRTAQLSLQKDRNLMAASATFRNWAASNGELLTGTLS